ncbi:MAG TPA: translation initiation factor IF-2 [Terriglobales bacterium]|nr:translation initiation factor IF-2 [Terriglobales bacterium]
MRINELARELEIPSKQVIEALPKIGIADKKSHSSKVEPDEVEKIRNYFRASSDGEKPGGATGRVSRDGDEIKPKFDLSHISKPGDVLKAIQQKQAEPPAPARPVARPAAPSIAAKAPAAPPAPAKAVAPAAPAPVAPPKPAPRFITPESVAPRPPAPIVRPEPKAPAPSPAEKPPEISATAAPAQPVAPVAKPAPPAPETAAVQTTTSPAPTRPAPPPPPRPAAPRVIVPQTGPRPVYQAPAQPRSLTPTPGQPIARRPMPGQPIAQRPRPSAAPGSPGMRPMGPGGRRPMHPTSRPMTPGARPGFGPRPMGVPPAGGPPAPGQRRPGANRRPGQQYVPRGVKEGPMKGFVPPPRLTLSTEPLPITREITITEGISVKDLAEKLGIRAKDLIARLLARGVFATINQTLDQELAAEMSRQFGADAKVISFEEQLLQDTGPAQSAEQVAETMQSRPPVVTIMGHVDHGKTTLLDSIRQANVAGGEAGGITQHIGAYKVRISDPNSPAYGREIAFIDTPGHEAFTRMRARGAKVTDIVVLVVAADDGVMPQTLEAIDHAKAANVPIIVAVNKIDKPDALPDRVKKQLADRGLMPEDWGGNTVFVDVSAKQKTNLNLLLEMICLVADLQELKTNPDRSANGTVLEAKLDRGRGPVATVLIQSGTLKVGDAFVAGNIFGRVRAMFDDRGNAADQAGPSTPVEILGAEGLPAAGDQFVVAERERAQEISEYRTLKAREAQLAKTSRVSLEGLSEQIKTAGVKELPIILKGDVQGSIEVLSDLLTKLSNEKVKIKLLHSGVGAITETDVLLASASNAIIIGFNVRPERKAQELAEQEKVDIRLHSIIYELQDEIKRAMSGLLEPVIKETYHGRAEVRETFRIPKVGTIAGCYMQDGLIKRDDEVRLLRDNVVVFKGKVGSLRRFKDDVNEVRNGQECGIGIAGYGDIKVGDVIEGFVTERIAQEVFA